jgi:hypothetical protein
VDRETGDDAGNNKALCFAEVDPNALAGLLFFGADAALEESDDGVA